MTQDGLICEKVGKLPCEYHPSETETEVAGGNRQTSTFLK